MSKKNSSDRDIRGGNRGGRDQFNWEDVKGMKYNDRYQYLGFTARTENLWYANGGKTNTQIAMEQLEREKAMLKAEEDRVMEENLGLRKKTRRVNATNLQKSEMTALEARGAIERDEKFDTGRAAGLGFAPAIKPEGAGMSKFSGDSARLPGMNDAEAPRSLTGVQPTKLQAMAADADRKQQDERVRELKGALQHVGTLEAQLSEQRHRKHKHKDKEKHKEKHKHKHKSKSKHKDGDRRSRSRSRERRSPARDSRRSRSRSPIRARQPSPPARGRSPGPADREGSVPRNRSRSASGPRNRSRSGSAPRHRSRSSSGPRRRSRSRS